jgi:hypothetical protein
MERDRRRTIGIRLFRKLAVYPSAGPPVPTAPILLKLCSAGSGLIELIRTDGVARARARTHARGVRIFMQRSNSSVDIRSLDF